jgi:mannose-1-phosphate guanylyltransferase/mannose-6-phosphate isomerase
MPSHDARAVMILAGGAGTRLWPLSTEARPKQFLPIFDGHSLLEHSYVRLRRLVGPEAIFVSTNERYRELVREQLPDLAPENILVEPARRNTAPAIATCCAEIERRIHGATVGIFPSDQSISALEEFINSVSRAFDFAEKSGSLVTLGIRPTEPNTGFGYIETGAETAPGVFRVERFIEKPSREVAEDLVASKRYLWNAGIFLWRIDAFFRELSAAAPDICEAARRFAAAPGEAEKRAEYEAMRAISIDYALMERAHEVATVPGDFGWSDVGSWAAVAAISPSLPSSVVTEDAQGVWVHSDSTRPVAVVGLDHVAVVDSPDGLLVVNLDKSQLLSKIVDRVKRE